jgi:hypothetical protein
MMRMTWIFLAISAMGSSPSAQAGLGQKIDSISKDNTSMRGKYRLREATARYTVHEIQSGNIQIREYADGQGTVFAVTWHGGYPQLGVLLANYFPAYHSARATTPRHRGMRKRLHVENGDLTVIQFGQMRTLGGIAYVKSLLPSGVDVGSLP